MQDLSNGPPFRTKWWLIVALITPLLGISLLFVGDWPMMAAYLLFVFSAFCGFALPGTTQWNHASIRQFSFRGWRQCSWEDINLVTTTRHGYDLHSDSERFRINPILYSNASEVEPWLRLTLSRATWKSR